MEDVKNFLKAVLEPTGWLYLWWVKPNDPEEKKYLKFIPAGDYKTMADMALQLDKLGAEVYFCTSTLSERTNRKEPNAKMCKVFKLDIDIDPNNPKKYSSRAEAVVAIEAFCKKVGLPLPVFVKSGGGIHVYFIIEDALPAQQMGDYQDHFKTVCIYHGLKADHGITADVVRILRVPGTHNHKIPDRPREVKLASPILVYDNATIINAIEAAFLKVPASEGGAAAATGQVFGGGMSIPKHIQVDNVDAASLRMFGDKPKSFKVIWAKSDMGKNGCAQIKRICDRKEESRLEISEPSWWDAVSIAANCDDGPDMIQEISIGGKGYSPRGTEEKAKNVLGKPHRCVTFNGNFPDVCTSCEHWGNITSPIQLGDYTPLAKPTDNIVHGINRTLNGDEGAKQKWPVPQYPFPYARREGGGVVLPDKDELKPATLVCKYDFYATNRLSENNIYYVQFRVHKPKDGTFEFMIPTADIGAKDKLQKFLNERGIMSVEENTKTLRGYILRWIDYMENIREAELVKEQFGWTENQASFVVGAKEHTVHESKYSPPAPRIENIAAFYRSKGTLEGWRDAFNTYARQGAEGHAFSAMIGFGSPLMPFLGLDGAVVNLMSELSGIGKTVSMLAQLSIWGDPKSTMARKKNTHNQKMHRLGVLQNLPYCLDEMTMARVDEVSDLLLEITDGRGKDRMEGASNSERINTSTWSTIVTMSSNTNFTEKIQAERDGANGEIARLVEFEFMPIPGMRKRDLDALAKKFKENYGHAHERYMRYIVQNKEEVDALVEKERDRFDIDVKVEDAGERYWTAVFACAYVGGVIAKKCNLHAIDMENLRRWMIGIVKVMRKNSNLNSKANGTVIDSTLGEFLTLHTSNTLIAYSNNKSGTFMVPSPPHHNVVVRHEPDFKRVYVLKSAFKEYCTKRHIHLQAFLDEQKAKGVFITEGRKRMLTGWMPSEPAITYEFVMDDAGGDLLPGVIKD